MNTAPIVSKVWSFCTTLRDDGVSYGDYLEQLTYLIFLDEMADEYARPPYNRDVGIPAESTWRAVYVLATLNREQSSTPGGRTSSTPSSRRRIA